MSNEELNREFNLEGKHNFWKYLQMRDCIKSGFSNCTENYILDYLNVPQEHCTASQFYKLTNSFISSESSKGLGNKLYTG